MAKRGTAKRGVAPRQMEPTVKTEAIKLTLEERNHLSEILRDPIFTKAWNNAKWEKPSAFVSGQPNPLSTPMGLQVASNRLHEIRGWELFEAAITRQIKDPPIAKGQVVENWQKPL